VTCMDPSDVSGDFASKLTRQEYGAAKTISGVKLIDFNLFADDGGDFHELARLNGGVLENIRGFEVRQINRSRFNPGLVKAFHLHMKQDEIWAVHPLDRLLLGLLDVRKGSETESKNMRVLMGGGKTKMIYVPRGVAHGATVLGDRPVDVIYLTNEQFSVRDSDEWRLPWDMLGADFWQIRKE
jgi:dTDP-4-dehydrorhamnose 3,5-epimerase